MAGQSHRYEIDVLRTLAVLSVVIFHAAPDAMPGGFLGVDVFFVISGFVISRKLRGEIERGEFTLKGFYLGRFKRLFAPLFVTVAGSVVLAQMLPANIVRDVAISGFSAFTAWSNLFFLFGSGYFDTDAHLKPLLHTWSLGVEEQFYVFFPLFMMALWRLRRWHAQLLLVAVFLASLAYSQWTALNAPNWSFYFLASRVFEFAFGCWIAMFADKTVIRTRQASRLLTAIALVGLIACMFVFGAEDTLPGLWAIIPCGLTAVVIYASQDHPLPDQGFVFRHFAKISYSLYLAHWPIVVFIAYRFAGRETWWLPFAMLAACYIGGAALFYVIERPVRRARGYRPAALVAAASVVLAFGISARVFTDTSAIVRLDIDAMDFDTVAECKTSPESDFCSADILLVGDSHAAMFRSALKSFAEPLSVAASTAAGCAPVFGAVKIYGDPRYKQKIQNCAETVAMWAANLADTSARVVVFDARWELFLVYGTAGGFHIRQDYLVPPDYEGVPSLGMTRKVFDRQFAATIEAMLAAGKKVVVLGELPMQWQEAVVCSEREAGKDDAFIDETCGAVSWKSAESRAGSIDSRLKRIVDQYAPDALFVSVTDVLCDGGICGVSLDGKPIYQNNNHLNVYGATKVLEAHADDLRRFLSSDPVQSSSAAREIGSAGTAAVSPQ